MSETIITLKARFKEIATAKSVVDSLRKSKSNSLKQILASLNNSTSSSDQAQDIWFMESISRSKNFVSLTVMGPPSGGDFDFVIQWLVDSGGYSINGEILTTIADVEPEAFSIYQGKPVTPDVDIEKIIRNHPGDSTDINKRDGAGNTPLHYAVEQGNLKKARALIEAGADINSLNDAGAPPIFLITGKDIKFDTQKEMIKIFLSQGQDLKIKTDRDYTLVDLAYRTFELKLVSYLKELGVSENVSTSFNRDYELAKRIYEEMRGGTLGIDESTDEPYFVPIAASLNDNGVSTFSGAEEWGFTEISIALSAARKLHKDGVIQLDKLYGPDAEEYR